MGSPADAVAVLDALAAARYEVVAVYTQPDAVAGRSRTPAPTAVRRRAEELGISVETPASLKDPEVVSRLSEYGADAFVVAAYGRLIPRAALNLPRLGAVNLHPSLLPRFRGPSPISTAILEGDTATGVTIMLLDEGMDTGPLLLQSGPVAIEASDTCGSLTAKLFKLGSGLLITALQDLEAGRARPTPQDPARATTTKLLERSDGQMDWTMPAPYLERMVRAYDPWPGTFTRWDGRVLKVLQSSTAAETRPAGEPGTVVVAGDGLGVIAGDSMLEIVRLQLEGRNAQAAPDFLRGYPRIIGAKLDGQPIN